MMELYSLTWKGRRLFGRSGEHKRAINEANDCRQIVLSTVEHIKVACNKQSSSVAVEKMFHLTTAWGHRNGVNSGQGEVWSTDHFFLPVYLYWNLSPNIVSAYAARGRLIQASVTFESAGEH